AYVAKKAAERRAIHNEIQELSKKRQEYIRTNTPSGASESSLDAVMLRSIKSQAKVKKLDW
ncbi:MAG: hypothetical protein ACK5YT_00915, partial [Bacteroidota bacterium]